MVQGRAQPGLHKHRGIVARTGWTRCPEVGLTEGFQVVTKTAKVVPATKVHICSVNPDVWGQTNRYEFQLQLGPRIGRQTAHCIGVARSACTSAHSWSIAKRRSFIRSSVCLHPSAFRRCRVGRTRYAIEVWRANAFARRR